MEFIQQPPAMDPTKHLEVNKRTFVHPRFRMQIIDNGDKVWALFFHPEKEGQGAYVETDSTSTGYLKGIQLTLNPFIVPEKMLDTPQMRGAVESYSRVVTRLAASTLTVENTPFPTNMTTLDAVEIESGLSHTTPARAAGLRIFGPNMVRKTFGISNSEGKSLVGTESNQQADPTERAVQNARAVGQASDHLPAPPPRQSSTPKKEKNKLDKMEIFLPQASSFRVLLDMGDGIAPREDAAVMQQGAYVWEGSLVITQENWTKLDRI